MKQIGYPEAEVFKTADSFVITTHIHPDGDAAGSVIGLCLALRDMNRDAAIVLAQPLPPSYLFLPGSDMVMAAASDTAPSPPCPPGTVPRPRPEGTRRRILSSAARPRPGLKECGVQGRAVSPEAKEAVPCPVDQATKVALDMAPPGSAQLQGKRFAYGIVLDCASLDRAGKEMAGILENCDSLINIDHHISNTIVTDTGSFQYQNATSRCHLAASMLLDLGANHRNVQQCLNEQKTYPASACWKKDYQP